MRWPFCNMTLSILKRLHHLILLYLKSSTSFPAQLGFLTKKILRYILKQLLPGNSEWEQSTAEALMGQPSLMEFGSKGPSRI